MQSIYFRIVLLAGFVLLTGCTTEAAKKAMDRPTPADQYSGFGNGAADKSKRVAEKPKPVRDDMQPEEAVSLLVKQMQDSSPAAASYAVAAEQQMHHWAHKPGVAPLVVNGVRPLLKSPDIEQRAPALRLTIAYGGKDSTGDLIECMADSEYGVREMAYRAVRKNAPRELSFDPQAGEVARAQGVDQYRRWWQYEMQKGSVLPPTIYDKTPVHEATVQSPKQRQAVTSEAESRR